MTTDTDVIEATGREVAVSEASSPALFGTTEPAEIMARAESISSIFMDKVRQHRDKNGKQDLVANINGKEYVCVGGWTLMGSLVGVFPVTVWTKPVQTITGEGGWEARVEARTLSGAVVGAAEAMCTHDEIMETRNGPKPRWEGWGDYALRSMAQTRATSKALRMPLGFIAQLAGYEGTPAEEMAPAGQFARDESRRPDAGGARIPPTDKPEQADVRPPNCKQHGAMRFRKAGVSRSSGKPYPSFWSCVERECKVSVNHADWLSQSQQMNTPSAETADLGDPV